MELTLKDIVTSNLIKHKIGSFSPKGMACLEDCINAYTPILLKAKFEAKEKECIERVSELEARIIGLVTEKDNVSKQMQESLKLYENQNQTIIKLQKERSEYDEHLGRRLDDIEVLESTGRQLVNRINQFNTWLDENGWGELVEQFKEVNSLPLPTKGINEFSPGFEEKVINKPGDFYGC